MVRFLLNLVVYFLAALIGLIVADLLLSGLSISGGINYLVTAGVFALIQAILSPLINGVTRKSAPVFIGGVGIISAFVALLVTDLLRSGLTVDGLSTWIAASVVIWLAGACAAFILPYVIIKNRVEDRRAG
jgi:uncharacterized membrane protein YvlD (DUF360 family)